MQKIIGHSTLSWVPCGQLSCPFNIRKLCCPMPMENLQTILPIENPQTILPIENLQGSFAPAVLAERHP